MLTAFLVTTVGIVAVAVAIGPLPAASVLLSLYYLSD